MADQSIPRNRPADDPAGKLSIPKHTANAQGVKMPKAPSRKTEVIGKK